MSQAYPLSWPPGWQRTASPQRQSDRFKVTVSSALRFLEDEVRRLGGKNLVISSNCSLGNMRPPDPGVCAYFDYQGIHAAIPCDRWLKVEANVHAIAKTIEAMRGIDRWGAKNMIKAAFSGFSALPAPSSSKPWREVLQLPSGQVGIDDARAQYRRLSSTLHPDRPGGSHAAMAELNAAWEQAQQALGGDRG